MRAIRFIPPGSVVEITGRCFQERLLLLPTPRFTEIALGALGRAQRLYGIPLHGIAILGNHYHLLATAESPEQLARFVGYFQAKIAKEVARLTGWRQKIWGRRYRAILVSDEPAAQVNRLAYLIQQGVKEGLVSSPCDWPGVHSAKIGDCGSLRGTWFDRTRECNARSGRSHRQSAEFPSPEVVEITPIPAWQGLARETRSALFADLVDQAVEIGRRLQRTTGRTPLGVRAILRQRHDQRPEETKRSPAPFCHAASRRVREALITAYREFLLVYRIASDRLRRGLPAHFPDYCFPPPMPLLRPG